MGKAKQFLKKILPASYKKIDDVYKLALTDFKRNPNTPIVMLDYEVQLVEHCNLNCKSCAHFCPVAKEEFLDVKEYEKDCKRLSELFDGEARFIRLMGGEPLLHPDIDKFFEITRKYFPYTVIDLDTNGTLILSMKDKFWKALRENDINLTLTKYPIKLDVEKIKEKCKQENAKFRYFFNEDDVEEFNLLPLDLEGREPIECNFNNCYLANSCHTLKHGKLFTCSTIPHVEHFNEHFNQNLRVSKKDYIDIYEAKTDDEILNFLAKPVPFCRYCKVNGRRRQDWGISKKDIKEWT